MKISLRLNALLKILHSLSNIIIPLIVGPYVIRTLSKENYNAYTKANVEIQLFLMLASICIFTYGIRCISKIRENKEEAKKNLAEIYLYNIFLTLIFFGLYFLYIILIDKTTQNLYFILMIQFFGNLITVEWFIEALENYKFITFKALLIKIIYIISIFTLLKSDNVIIYTFIVSITFILDSLASFLYVFFKYKLNFKNLNLKRHFKPLFLTFLISNISLLYMQLDKIMLGLLVSDNAVTTYTIPSYIVTSIYNVVISIFVVAVPRLNNYYQNKSKGEFIKLYNEVIKTFQLVFIPILVFTFVLSKDIINWYASGKYNDSIIPLKIFCLVIFLNATTYLQREGILYVFELEKSIIKFNLIGGIINVTSNFLLYLLKVFTPINSIITLGLSFLFLTIVMRIYVFNKIDKKIVLVDKDTLKYFLLSLIVIIINYFFSLIIDKLIFKIFIVFLSFGILYLIFLIIFKDKILLINYKIIKEKLGKRKSII